MSDIITVRVGGQDFGVLVTQVRDVLRHRKPTPVPLAPPAVAGLLNLRGRIVTAIDLGVRLGWPPQAAGSEATHIVVENSGEFYALVVDSVGDVMPLDERQREAVPPGRDRGWRGVASGAYRTTNGLVVLLDIARLLDFAPPRRAAAS